MQASEMSQLEEDLGLSTSSHNVDHEDTLPSPQPQPQPRSQETRRQPSWLPPPGPPPTPFYLAAGEASHLQLEFVIPGFNGETLGQAVNNLDLAFVLQQTLRRRGWGEVMTTKGVEDFLECRWSRLLGGGQRGSSEDCEGLFDVCACRWYVYEILAVI
jgi:hypothetical protein